MEDRTYLVGKMGFMNLTYRKHVWLGDTCVEIASMIRVESHSFTNRCGGQWRGTVETPESVRLQGNPPRKIYQHSARDSAHVDRCIRRERNGGRLRYGFLAARKSGCAVELLF